MLTNLPIDTINEIIMMTTLSEVSYVMIRHTCSYFAQILTASRIRRPVCHRIVATGDISLLEWAIDTDYTQSADLSSIAAEYGHLHMVKYLHQAGHSCTNNTLNTAAGCGYLDIVKFAVSSGCDDKITAIKHAAAAGHVNICTWLNRDNTKLTSEIGKAAIDNSRINALDWYLTNNPYYNSFLNNYAHNVGNLPSIKYFKRHGLYTDWGLSYAICRNGHLHVIQWYAGKEPRFHDIYDVVSAQYGHLHCLQWFKEVGLPINYRMCISAAKNHPDCIEWLTTNQQ